MELFADLIEKNPADGLRLQETMKNETTHFTSFSKYVELN